MHWHGVPGFITQQDVVRRDMRPGEAPLIRGISTRQVQREHAVVQHLQEVHLAPQATDDFKGNVLQL